MDETQNNWSKTLLSTYGYLETIVGAIDKTVLNYGINSAICTDTEFVANKMISLIERKKFLINIKILVDNILKRMDNGIARVLVLKYVDKIKAETASQILGISIRTFFRKIGIGIEQFSRQLSAFGYTPEKLYSVFKDEGWVMEMYSNYSKKGQKEFDIESINFLGMALSSLKRKTARAY